jgi:hypothetical protein
LLTFPHSVSATRKYPRTELHLSTLFAITTVLSASLSTAFETLSHYPVQNSKDISVSIFSSLNRHLCCRQFVLLAVSAAIFLHLNIITASSLRFLIMFFSERDKPETMDPDCAICGSPAIVQCDCEAKGLDTAVRQAEHRMMSTYFQEIRSVTLPLILDLSADSIPGCGFEGTPKTLS